MNLIKKLSIFTTIIYFLSFLPLGSNNTEYYEINELNPIKCSFFYSYSIELNGDLELNTLIESNSSLFAGNGTGLNPYRIENIHFTANSTSNYALSIINITKHLVIQNSIFSNGKTGFSIENSTNLSIINCTFTDNQEDGISVSNTNEISITNNIITKNGRNGIYIYQVSNSSFENNSISFNFDNGIQIDGFGNNLIQNNQISYNKGMGISNRDVMSNIVHNNTISNNFFGIWFGGSKNSSIEQNFIINNSNWGVSIGDSNDFIINENIIHSNFEEGLLFGGSNSRMFISSNLFSYNRYYGLELGATSNSTISNNDFLNNNLIRKGNYTHGNAIDNFFTHNFWDVFDCAQDLNNDGYFDDPFLIDGIGVDYSPRIQPRIYSFQQFLSRIEFESYSYLENEKVIAISWLPVFDSFGHDINYTLVVHLETTSFSRNITLIQNTRGTEFELNISDILTQYYGDGNGTFYLKVESSGNLSSTIISRMISINSYYTESPKLSKLLYSLPNFRLIYVISLSIIFCSVIISILLRKKELISFILFNCGLIILGLISYSIQEFDKIGNLTISIILCIIYLLFSDLLQRNFKLPQKITKILIPIMFAIIIVQEIILFVIILLGNDIWENGEGVYGVYAVIFAIIELTLLIYIRICSNRLNTNKTIKKSVVKRKILDIVIISTIILILSLLLILLSKNYSSWLELFVYLSVNFYLFVHLYFFIQDEKINQKFLIYGIIQFIINSIIIFISFDEIAPFIAFNFIP